MLEIGKQIGSYVLVKKLGAGGFGEVWQAEKQTKLSVNNFALKFFRPKEEDRFTLEKEKREIGIWQKVSGLPNVISIIEADQFEDYVYVVSEYADGGSLEKQMSERAGRGFSVEETVNIALEILSGLNSLHQMSFVHRDVKPANILIRRGVYCLADFGISREMKAHSKATQTAGTYEYMSPESFENRPVTIHSDIWAVGAIMQQLLTGTLPFPQKEVPSLIYAILHGEPLRISENIPFGIRQIVEKALAKNPQDRFASAGEMIKALKYQQMLLHNPDWYSKHSQENLTRPAGEKTLKISSDSFPQNSEATFVMSPKTAPSVETQNSALPPISNIQTPKAKSGSTIFYVLGGVLVLFLLIGAAGAAFVYKNTNLFKTNEGSVLSNTSVNATTNTNEINQNSGQKAQTAVETNSLLGNQSAGNNKKTAGGAQQAETTPEIIAKPSSKIVQPKRDDQRQATTKPTPVPKKQNLPKDTQKKNSDCIFTGDC